MHLRQGGRQPGQGPGQAGHRGKHYASWIAQAGSGSFGQSVVDHNGKLYLAAGGSDFVAEFAKTAGGVRGWKQDTSGSAQAVAVYDGHWWSAGTSTTSATIKQISVGPRPGRPQLDPNGDCQLRQGIAAYSLDGQLDPDWNPALRQLQPGLELHAERLRLHTGGEFRRSAGWYRTHTPGSRRLL